MKLVVSLINPSKLEALKKALWTSGFRGVTVTDARGFGFQKSRMDPGKSEDYIVEFSPRVRVEVAVKDEEAGRLVEIVLETVRTGRIGDGKIFIQNLDQVVRVRTGERGETAL